MNYFFAGLILSVWVSLVIISEWDNKMPAMRNILLGLVLAGILCIVYWIPFWLIFLK